MHLLRSLEYFVLVAEHASFSRAADYLGVAQPPVSRRIAELEKHLGVRLFDRSRRHIELTTAGKYLLPEASEVLRRVENLQKVVRPNTKDFRVGVAGDLDPATLADVRHDLRIRNTSVQLVPVSDTPALDEQIASGELEGGLIVGELGGDSSKFSPKVVTDLFVEMGVASPRYATEAQSDSGRSFSLDKRPAEPYREGHLDPRVDIGTLRGMPAAMDLSRIASSAAREKILILPEDARILDDSRLLTPLVKHGIHLRQLEVADSEFAAVAHSYSHNSALLCTEIIANKSALPFRRLTPPLFVKRVYVVGSTRLDLLGEMNANSLFKHAIAAVLGATANLQHRPRKSVGEGYADEKLYATI